MPAIDLTKRTFPTAQVVELTGISRRKLHHWDCQGVVKPSASPASGRGSRRLYTYRDMLALRVVKSLRDHGISLQKVRKCVQYLRKRLPAASQALSFWTLLTDGATVYLVEHEQTLVDTVKRQGQMAWAVVCLTALDRELRQKVRRLSTRRVEEVTVGDYAYQVEIEPDVESGGFVAEVAGLPGCITEGETVEETLGNVRDAIETYLEAVDDLAKRGVQLVVRRRKKSRRARA